jgi:hypothetical protein
MKEINNMLNTWIYNTIIRKQLKDLIYEQQDFNLEVQSILWEYISKHDIEEIENRINKLENDYETL